MPHRSDIIYRYDGSFDGLMCCVYDSFYARELPVKIIDYTETQDSLFDIHDVLTDAEKAGRVTSAITAKISEDAFSFVFDAYLTDLPEKELHMLNFLYLGFRHGRKIMKMLTNDTVCILNKAVTHLLNETALLRGFVRFSDFGGGLVSTIEPKNNVLPLLRHHFLCRYPDGNFIIYDKTHSFLLAASHGESRIIKVDDFTPPSADADEIHFRLLWKRFYDTIAVEGRENPKCRMSHMPKRYWAHLTELKLEQGGELLTVTDENAITDGQNGLSIS